MKNLSATPRLTRLVTARLLAAATGLGLLAACGGGGSTADASMTPDRPAVPTPDGPTAPTPVTPTDGPLTPAQERTAATALVNQYAPAGVPVYTPLSAIRTTGAFTYDGFFYAELADRSDSVTDSMIGALELRAAFTATSVNITGSVTGISDDDDDALTGRLTLSGGALNRNGNPANDATLTARVAGTLTDDAGRDLDFGGQLEGDFLGNQPDAVGGEVLGAVSVDGDSQRFNGGFIAAR